MHWLPICRILLSLTSFSKNKHGFPIMIERTTSCLSSAEMSCWAGHWQEYQLHVLWQSAREDQPGLKWVWMPVIKTVILFWHSPSGLPSLSTLLHVFLMINLKRELGSMFGLEEEASWGIGCGGTWSIDTWPGVKKSPLGIVQQDTSQINKINKDPSLLAIRLANCDVDCPGWPSPTTTDWDMLVPVLSPALLLPPSLSLLSRELLLQWRR